MLSLLSDENFNGDIIRGLFLRQPNLDLLRVQDVGLREVDDTFRSPPTPHPPNPPLAREDVSNEGGFPKFI